MDLTITLGNLINFLLLLGGGIGVWVLQNTRIASQGKDIEFLKQLRLEDKKDIYKVVDEIRDDYKTIIEGINKIQVELQNKADRE